MFKSIDTYSVSELKEEAKFLGLKGYSKLRKSELVELIKQHNTQVITKPKDEVVTVPTKNKEDRLRYIPTFSQDTQKKRSHPLDQWFAKFRNDPTRKKIVKI